MKKLSYPALWIILWIICGIFLTSCISMSWVREKGIGLSESHKKNVAAAKAIMDNLNDEETWAFVSGVIHGAKPERILPPESLEALAELDSILLYGEDAPWPDRFLSEGQSYFYTTQTETIDEEQKSVITLTKPQAVKNKAPDDISEEIKEAYNWGYTLTARARFYGPALEQAITTILDNLPIGALEKIWAFVL